MANKQQVLELHARHPTMTAQQIAERLQCSDAYVRATFYRNGLTVPGVDNSPEHLVTRAKRLEARARELHKKAAKIQARGAP